MTAINVILQDEQALIMTDTAAYSQETGIPHSFHRKCVPAPSRTVAICSRGDVRLTNAFAQAFPEVYADIDDAVADDFDVLRRIYEIHLSMSDDPKRLDFCDVVFVGWSAMADAPIGCMLARRDGTWESRAIDPAEGLHAPAFEGQAMVDFSEQADVDALDWTPGSFDPRRHGLILLEAQRRLKFTMPGLDLPPMNLIGGAVHLTTLTRRGVAQEVIHDWHDPIGVPIQPKPYVPAVAAPQGLNRQQRRAWDRKHRRAA